MMFVLKLETVDCSIEGEERLIYIQLTKHRNFQNEGSAIQQFEAIDGKEIYFLMIIMVMF